MSFHSTTSFLSVLRATALLVLAACVTACTAPAAEPRASFGAPTVQQAYNTSGMVQVPKYTRTIFSSIDF